MQYLSTRVEKLWSFIGG